MVRNSIIAVALLFSITSYGQDDRGKITSAFSFAPGFLTEKTYTIQLQGSVGYLKNKIEARADAFYFLGSYGDRPRFSMNHQIFVGAMYHFTETAFQPYVGFQPGIALSQSSEYGTLNNETGDIEFKKSINPLGSAVAGFTYYGEKLFFVFVEGRYIFGKHKANTYPTFLDEARVSFGLGFFF